jgi:hypothetical protein
VSNFTPEGHHPLRNHRLAIANPQFADILLQYRKQLLQKDVPDRLIGEC